MDYQRGDIAQRRTLEALALETYDQIIVLPYARDLEPQAADAISLITLLNVREMLQRVETPPRIVTEMLDMGNGQLAEATGADDFIVSSHLTSLAVAQVSQNPRLSDVFTELLCPAGNEIFLREPGAYGLNGAEINFATAVEAARRVGHVAFGYRMRIPGPTREQAWRIILNPPKSERISLREGDRIVVIAQD